MSVIDIIILGLQAPHCDSTVYGSALYILTSALNRDDKSIDAAGSGTHRICNSRHAGFTHPSVITWALQPIQPAIQRVQATFFAEVKCPGNETNHSSPRVKNKNVWDFTFIPSCTHKLMCN
jgi:hypothetical protein